MPDREEDEAGEKPRNDTATKAGEEKPDENEEMPKVPEPETWEVVPIAPEHTGDDEGSQDSLSTSHISVAKAELVGPAKPKSSLEDARVKKVPKARPPRRAGFVDGSNRGMLNRRGLSNGQGLVNGNGLVNGGKRGLVNGRGLSNGNGMVNGRRRGMINGRGLSNGNGMVNGRRHGMVNGRGLTNGNGMVNGRGLVNGKGIVNGNGMMMDDAPPRPRRRTGWMAAGVVAVLLMVVVMSYFLLFSTEKGIRIDGSFSDWSGVKKFQDSATDTTNPEINIVETAVTVDGSSASFYVKTEGKALGGRNNGVDSVYIFIDTDQNAATGYRIDSVGAEYVLAVDGYDGHVSASGLYKFSKDPARPSNDWNSRTAVGSSRAAASGSELETQVPVSDLGIPGSGRLNAVVYTKDGAGAEDFGPLMSNEKSVLNIRWSQVGPSTVSPGSTNVPLLKLELESTGKASTVNSLRVWVNEGTTTTDIGALSLYTSSGVEIPGMAGTLSGGSVLFIPSTPLKVTSGDAVAMTVYSTVPAGARTGRAIGLFIDSPSDVSADTKAVSVEAAVSQLSYIGAASHQIVIDGAFSDWSAIPSHPDPAGDVADPNIDLTDFRVTNDTDSFYFFSQVDGTMMGGAGIPEAKLRPSGTGGGGGGQVQLPVLAGEDSFYLFIDADGRSDTGYSGGGVPLGADFMVLVSGQYGRVLERQVHSFTGGADRTKWSWSAGTDIPAATDSARMELQVPLGALGDPKGNVSLFYYTTDWKALRDAGGKLSYDLRAPGGGRSLPPGYLPPAGGLPFGGDDHSNDPGVPEFRDTVVPLAGMAVLFLALRRKRDRAGR